VARQLFGAICLRPSARSDKAQVSAHPDFRELPGAVPPAKAEVRFVLLHRNIGFRFWNFL